MDINELFEPEDWADLPQDSEEAFARLVQVGRSRYQSKLAVPDQDENAVQDIRYGYMNTVLGIAQSFNIEPFHNMGMPPLENFDQKASREFENQIAFFLAKAQANIAKRQRAGMVDITARDRLTIRMATQKLRQKVEASDLPAWKKKRLIDTLRDFEQQLGAGRVNLTTITLTVVALMSAPGGLAQSYDWAKDVFEPILRPLMEAKAQSDMSALANATLVKPRLSPPSSLATIPAKPKF